MTRSINLPDALYARLSALAEEKGVKVSTIIQMACKEYADREDAKKQ